MRPPSPTPWLTSALALALASLLTLWPADVGARDERLRWRTLDTAHFQVHYPAHLEALARRSARVCEEAWRVLTPTLVNIPSQRTQVLLTDFGDGANGSATAQPYLLVNLFAAPPAMDGNLNEFDDWLRQLVYHEFVHILHLDTTTGWPAFFNQFFGRQYAPNQNMPRFLVEGLAVWLESATSGYGRVNSATFRGYLRAQALAGRLFGLDAATHIPLEWPGANVWYLYGGHFIDWVVRHRTPEGVARMNYAISDDLIPYAMNRGAQAGFGQTLEDLWHAWQGDLVAQARVTEARLEAEGGVTRPRMLSWLGRTHQRPRFLPDGTLLSLESDGLHPRAIQARRPDGTASDLGDVFVRVDATENFDVCGDGETLILDQSERHDGVYSWFDLYSYHAPTERMRRLTRGARLREPTCAPSAKWVAAVQVIAGRTRLVKLDLATRQLSVLYDPGDLDQVAFPTIHPDDRTVVVTRLSQRFGRDLVAVDRVTGELRQLTADGALELHPRFSPSGDHLLYASDRTGILDLYALPWPGGTPRRLTRVTGGAMDPSVSPDGARLVFQLITAGGFDLAEIPFEPEAPLSMGEALRRPPPPRPVASAAPLPASARPYDPTETLWPVSWSPSFSLADVDGVATQVGMSATANDAGNQHILVADFANQPDQDAYSIDAAYSLQRFRVNLNLGLSHSTRTLLDAAVYESARQDYQEAVTTFGAGVSLPTTRTGHGTSVSLRYDLTRYAPGDKNPNPGFDPYDITPRYPTGRVIAGVSFGISYQDSESWPESITGEEGQRGGVTLRLRDPAFGSDFSTAEMFFNYTRYQGLWLRHSFVGRLSGAYGRGATRGRVRYGLGPAPERSLLLDQLDGIVFGSGYFRGYPPNTEVGNRYVLTQLEYRLPIVDLFMGPSAVPFFLNRLKLAGFTDIAQASDEPLEGSWGAFRRSVGVELLFESTVAWRQPFNVRLGWARGLDEDGEAQVYFFLGNWF